MFSLLITIVSYVAWLAMVVVLAQFICSHVLAADHKAVKFLNKVTEPVYKPFRKLAQKIYPKFDLTPFIVIFAIGLVRWIIVRILWIFV